MRREFLASVRLKVHKGFITDGTMEPLAIPDNFDPFKDGSHG
jgi:hypothetical protein